MVYHLNMHLNSNSSSRKKPVFVRHEACEPKHISLSLLPHISDLGAEECMAWSQLHQSTGGHDEANPGAPAMMHDACENGNQELSTT